MSERDGADGAVRVLVPGSGRGRALVLTEPLSLWGGLDPATGRVIDRRHPQCGAEVAGRVLVLPRGRGSSSASSILLETVRAGTAPAAIVLAEADPILALGATVARELYGDAPPVVVAPPALYATLCDGAEVTVDGEAGRIVLGAAVNAERRPRERSREASPPRDAPRR